MALTLQDLREDVWESTGTDSSDVPQTKVDQLLNRSYWEVSKKLKFRETESQFTLTLVPEQNAYAFSSYINDFDAIRHVTIKDTVSDSNRWQEVQQMDYQNLMDVEDDENYPQTLPLRYARFNNQIVFYPTPSAAYPVRIAYKKTLGDILLNGPSLPEEWGEIISYGAIARLWIQLGAPMRASAISQKQAEIISTMVSVEAEEERDYARSSASILRTRYP